MPRPRLRFPPFAGRGSILGAARSPGVEQDSEPAASRTALAEDRTILASERTFASWMRTSLASVAIGVGFQALFSKMEPAWVPKVIATGFLLLAIAVIVLAQRRAAAVMDRLSAHVVVTAKAVNLKLLTAAVSTGTLALIAAMWLLQALEG